MKTFKEIQEIVSRLNAETDGEFRVYDCTPAWSLNYHIRVESRKYCTISLESIDYSGFKNVYQLFNGNISGSTLKCTADNLYDYLLSLYNKEEARVALQNKRIEYKNQLADNEVLVVINGLGKETEKAIQIKHGITIEGGKRWYYNTFWLPKSQVRMVDELKAVVMPKWLAKKNCLSYIL